MTDRREEAERHEHRFDLAAPRNAICHYAECAVTRGEAMDEYAAGFGPQWEAEQTYRKAFPLPLDTERLATADRREEPATEALNDFLRRLSHTDPDILIWIRSLLVEREALPAPLDVEECGNCGHPYVQHTGRSIRPDDMERLPGSRLGPIKPRCGSSCEATAYPRSNREDWHHTCPCSTFVFPKREHKTVRGPTRVPLKLRELVHPNHYAEALVAANQEEERLINAITDAFVVLGMEPNEAFSEAVRITQPSTEPAQGGER